MPPFSADDFQKILEKIGVLETKILRLEVNMEVKDNVEMTQLYHWLKTVDRSMLTPGLWMLARLPKNRRALHWLINQPVKVLPGIVLVQNQRINHVPGKQEKEKQAEDSAATDWPALPSRQNASSTPVPIRKQPWTAAKGTISNKPPQ